MMIKTYINLQSATVDDLVVNGELFALIVDDKDSDAATTIVEGLGETVEEAALVEDWETLLDIASLGHGDDLAVIANVQNTVLLEDRTEHVLDDNIGRWGGDKGRLLVELLGEEINTEVAVLAGLSRSGDADDLARTTLENQEIANADVVAGDGDGVGWASTAGTGRAAWRGHGEFAFFNNDIFFAAGLFVVLVVVLVFVVVSSVDWVEDAVGSAV